MTQLDQSADELGRAIRKRTDSDSAVQCLMETSSSSKDDKEQQEAQFNVTLGQQNKHIEKLRTKAN
jgi:hypothetical protein